MNESYRTLLGHFRHEIGHFYWDKLIAPDAEKLGKFREIFGDDTYEYQLALDRHYQQGPPPNWQESYISSYATMHPWEDWAETWGHEDAYPFVVSARVQQKIVFVHQVIHTHKAPVI